MQDFEIHLFMKTILKPYSLIQEAYQNTVKVDQVSATSVFDYSNPAYPYSPLFAQAYIGSCLVQIMCLLRTNSNNSMMTHKMNE